MSAIRFFLTLLFLPILLVSVLIWLIYWKFWGKKQNIQEKKRKEFRQKVLAHIKNFSPTRLKNKSWQKSIGKSNKKTKKLAKRPNNKQK